MTDEPTLSADQKSYLSGFLRGVDAVRTRSGLPPVGDVLPLVEPRGRDAPLPPGRPELAHLRAQERFLAEGKKLAPEEEAKKAENPLDVWDRMLEHADAGRFPSGPDVFRWKFHGLFYVAPAEGAFMCRLRLPGGIVTAYQLRGVADVAERLAAGHADVTTRANLQLRGIAAERGVEVLTALHDLGIVPRGSGADNVRNVTGSPTAGIDPHELYDTRPLTRALHHHVLHHRELYGLPRKFNVAFDGGGDVGVLEDTNDLGFSAVAVGEGHPVPAGVYFRLAMGGITGHGAFARDAGVLLRPEECVPVAAALIRVFLEHGDRTDRQKARFKYLLDGWGHEKVLGEAEKLLARPLVRFPREACLPRRAWAKLGHVGVHPQKQRGLSYIGVVLPVGRLRADQMRGLADISERLGSGMLRLTVWQNIIVSDVSDDRLDEAKSAIDALGLAWRATSIRGALVACTGNTGCRYAATDTKVHALALAAHLEPKVELDAPVNIHLTGCPHSCAQHAVADIGLLGATVEVNGGAAQGYHLHVGGGAGPEQALGREIARDVPQPEVSPLIERLLAAYLARRREGETFHAFTARHEVAELRAMCTTATGAEP
jgi:ferredoxin-nitrite reductase